MRCPVKIIVFVIAMTVSLTSCVGYAVLSGDKSEIPKNAEGNMYAINDKAGILQVHGKPVKIEFKDGKEYWTYKKNIAFRGLIAALIIPIPLLIPTGYNKTVFEFNNDVRIKTTVEYSRTRSAFFCGFILTPENIRFGCMQ
jgi:hypothetical protein